MSIFGRSQSEESQSDQTGASVTHTPARTSQAHRGRGDALRERTKIAVEIGRNGTMSEGGRPGIGAEGAPSAIPVRAGTIMGSRRSGVQMTGITSDILVMGGSIYGRVESSCMIEVSDGVVSGFISTTNDLLVRGSGRVEGVIIARRIVVKDSACLSGVVCIGEIMGTKGNGVIDARACSHSSIAEVRDLGEAYLVDQANIAADEDRVAEAEQERVSQAARPRRSSSGASKPTASPKATDAPKPKAKRSPRNDPAPAPPAPGL